LLTPSERGIKGFASELEEDSSLAESFDEERVGRPEVLVRSIVATRKGAGVFGKRLVAEAHSRGFNAAQRKAFVADGAASNWSLHGKLFSHYTPILDFAHAICYVYGAAMTGRSPKIGWQEYCQWAQWVWEGHTEKVIRAVALRQKELGEPSEEESETSPKKIIANALRYLKNQRSRMKYAEYRRVGLPITSSYIESTIKQLNRRVKGTEKFWHEGAEPLLQLAADHISETNPLETFWQNRPHHLLTTRSYQSTA